MTLELFLPLEIENNFKKEKKLSKKFVDESLKLLKTERERLQEEQNKRELTQEESMILSLLWPEL